MLVPSRGSPWQDNHPFRLGLLLLALTASTFACSSGSRAEASNVAGSTGNGNQTSGGASNPDGSASGGAAGAGQGSGGTSGGVLADPCPALVLETEQFIAGASSDEVRWRDAECKPRSAALVRVGGGYVRRVTYDFGGSPRVITGTGAAGHRGWGYTVNHYGQTATIGQDLPGRFGAVFIGKHHTIYEYESTPRIAGHDVPVTQHWFFATGRTNPVLATTYDMTDIPAGALVADIRTPYGDLAWDGDGSDAVISGVGWGDRRKFRTTSAPLTANSSWDYTELNTVPYVHAWATETDAEMGAVQTETYAQHDAGGYWFYDNWGKTSDNQSWADGQSTVMTPDWNWTYQINQYELCFYDPSCLDMPTRSHRLAWGTNYGALGGLSDAGTGRADQYVTYGDQDLAVGHPYQSYSVFMVLGQFSKTPTEAQVSEVEAIQQTTLEPSVGELVTELPGGVGRTDSVPLTLPGFDPRYATFNLRATGGLVELSIDTELLENPVFVVQGIEQPSVVTLNGQSLAEDAGYFASPDPDRGQVWLTIRAALRGTNTLIIE